MKTSLLLAAVALLLASCNIKEYRKGNNEKASPSASAKSSDDAEAETGGATSAVGHPIPGEMMMPDGSDWVMIPIHEGEPVEDDDDSYEITIGSRTASRSGEAHYRNILFHNRKTGASHLLLSRPAAIYDVQFPVGDSLPGLAPYILYSMADADTDSSGRVDDDDTRGAFISAMDGSGLRRISPPESSFLSWYFDRGVTVYLRVRDDSDGSGTMDESDRIDVLRYDVAASAPARTILGDSLRAEIESSFKF